MVKMHARWHPVHSAQSSSGFALFSPHEASVLNEMMKAYPRLVGCLQRFERYLTPSVCMFFDHREPVPISYLALRFAVQTGERLQSSGCEVKVVVRTMLSVLITSTVSLMINIGVRSVDGDMWTILDGSLLNWMKGKKGVDIYVLGDELDEKEAATVLAASILEDEEWDMYDSVNEKIPFIKLRTIH